MKILILEDSPKKLKDVTDLLNSDFVDLTIDSASNFYDFLRFIGKNQYDLIIADLVVTLRAGDAEASDLTKDIINETRHHDCKNYRTPVIALTGYLGKAEEKFTDLNRKDITVITYEPDSDQWRTSLRDKVRSTMPPVHFDFVIVCALTKEAEAFGAAGYPIDEPTVIAGISCRKIQIGARRGVVVTAPRMGLVSAAIVSTQAIDLFKPSLICMSGICAGVSGEAKIYEVVIPDISHQNDAGKWTPEGFELESYSVQLEHEVRLKIQNLIAQPEFLTAVQDGVHLSRDEFPEYSDKLQLRVLLAPSSSGNAVVADEDMAQQIKGQRRKLHTFEMECYAVYEAARVSISQPKYFCAKAVVDDGTPKKGDHFHRVACLLSAKVVYECIASGIFDD